MNWKEQYQQRLTTAEEAVKRIKSGDRVVIGHAASEPSHVVEAMATNATAYQHVEIVHMVALGKCTYAQPGMESHFRHNAIFVGGSTRDAVASGRGDFTPCFFFEVPKLFSTTLPVDVALVSVTPPNENGMCSLGVSVDYTYAAVKNAKLVIAQVNDRMPYTGSGSLVSVFDIDCFVPFSAPIISLAPPKIGSIEQSIGEHCASLIRDGDTLQLGIGAIPDAVLLFLKDKHDLGIHSEMFSDGILELVKTGVVTNKKKTLHPCKFVALLDEGAAVTTSRNDVDYVVTEFGIAHLKGKTLRERARALIAIAHPNFRAALKEGCARRFNYNY